MYVGNVINHHLIALLLRTVICPSQQLLMLDGQFQKHSKGKLVMLAHGRGCSRDPKQRTILNQAVESQQSQAIINIQCVPYDIAGPDLPNIFLRSLTSASGCSYAAKWPPDSCFDSITILALADNRLQKPPTS